MQEDITSGDQNMKAKALVLQKSIEIDWSDFEESLHDHFGVNAVTLKKNGARRSAGDILWANGLCALIKTNPKGASRICDTIQKYLMYEVEARRSYATDECAAGIFKIVVPIIQKDEIEGFVSACGRPFLNTDRIYTYYIHKTIDADEEKIEKLLPSLNPIDPRTIKEMKHFITTYVP
jgi:ligand-binding sensor protein